MHRLIVVGGAEGGKVFDLRPGQYVVGRAPGVDVLLAEESVSRRHALITVAEDAVTVLDLDSHNGTRVNGQLVKMAPVGEGDELRFGSIHTTLERVPAPATATVWVEPSEGTRATAAGCGVALPEDARRLAILYQVGTAIAGTVELPELLQRVLAAIFDAVPAERGAILLWDDAEGQWRPSATHARCRGTAGLPSRECSGEPTAGQASSATLAVSRCRATAGLPSRECSGEPTAGQASSATLAVSRAIIEKAFEARGPLLSGDAGADARFGASDSIAAYAIRSTICCPLMVRDERLGVLHLDTPKATDAFSEDDLRLVGAIANQAAIAIANVRLHDALRQENVQLRRALGSRHRIVGTSPAMRELMSLVQRVSQTDATVLVRGESGTGKEVVAGTLHALSPRRARPFVCVNCAAVPETLLESELFGHEKGAFTGAVERRIGRFERADGGTVFLDEIAEMPPSTQAKILRVLQEREFQRVGGSRSIRVDVRLIASTNRDLEAAMASGDFRQDLYYRLKVIEIILPPLRERREDIAPLCEHFLAEVARDMGRQPPAVDDAARRLLDAYAWPGNVRELRNVLERALVLGVGERVLPRHLPREVRRGIVAREDLPDDLALSAAERRHVAAVLALTGWNKTRAASLLRISRPRLDRKIRDYGLRPPARGAGGE